MKLSASKLLVVIFFSTILALHSMRDVFAGIEIAYDDGRPETTSSLDIGMHLAVKFSLPPSLPKAQLVTVRVYKAGRSGVNMRGHILGSNGVTELTTPFNFRLAVESAWNDVDLGAQNIVVLDGFYITVEYVMYYDPLIGRDTTDPKSRSYYGRLGSWSLVSNGENVMIRAVVEPLITVSSTTTGTSLAENVLTVSASYLFSACVVALVLIAFAVRRSRRAKQASTSCTS